LLQKNFSIPKNGLAYQKRESNQKIERIPDQPISSVAASLFVDDATKPLAVVVEAHL
jgi:hypothetical protein